MYCNCTNAEIEFILYYVQSNHTFYMGHVLFMVHILLKHVTVVYLDGGNNDENIMCKTHSHVMTSKIAILVYRFSDDEDRIIFVPEHYTHRNIHTLMCP